MNVASSGSVDGIKVADEEKEVVCSGAIPFVVDVDDSPAEEYGFEASEDVAVSLSLRSPANLTMSRALIINASRSCSASSMSVWRALAEVSTVRRRPSGEFAKRTRVRISVHIKENDPTYGFPIVLPHSYWVRL